MAQVSMSPRANGPSSTSASSRSHLLELLSNDSDVQLVFEAADGAKEVVPAHKCILKWCSRVLAAAIDVADVAGKSGNSNQIIELRMDGTSEEDWLLAMEYVYPVTPQPTMTWDKMQTVLQVADKYEMSSVLQRMGTILSHNKDNLDLAPNSKFFVWEWVFVADRYGLFDTAQRMMKTFADHGNLRKLLDVCPMQRLIELSGHTLHSLVAAMADRVVGPDALYCTNCKAINPRVTGSGAATYCSTRQLPRMLRSQDCSIVTAHFTVNIIWMSTPVLLCLKCQQAPL